MSHGDQHRHRCATAITGLTAAGFMVSGMQGADQFRAGTRIGKAGCRERRLDLQ
jgi:hypothetical protein